jgi:hypothetical protein
MNLPYVLPRLIRHFLPEKLTRFLLLRSLIIKPGLETSDPQAAVQRYMEVLKTRNETLQGKRILVFGYGGRFDIGVGLLEAGASEVYLCDKYASPDNTHNTSLLPKYEAYLDSDAGQPRPRGDRMKLLQQDIRDITPSREYPGVDLVISNSVYEHVEDVDGTTRALSLWSEPDGMQVHFVDLRDHFFRYPFEMLKYSEGTWRRWMNPTSNHNRFRLRDYRRVFEKYFEKVEIEILQRDRAGFERAKRDIRLEFISGNLEDDSVTLIRILAMARRRPAEP